MLFADTTLLLTLSSSVQASASELHERCDVKLWVNGPSMTSDTPIAKNQKQNLKLKGWIHNTL